VQGLPEDSEADLADVDGPSLRRLKQAAPVLVGATVLATVAGFVQKLPCRSTSFNFVPTARSGCYTDIYPLYFARGLADGKVPYFDKIPEPVEYPVLTGWFMQGVNTLVRAFTNPGGTLDAVKAHRGMSFYDYTAAALALLAIVVVLASAYAAGRRSMRAGLMIALSPALILAAYINWDMLAVALTALAVAFWAARRPMTAGVFLGLAISAKFYPLVLLWPLVLLCVRAGQWRALGRLLGGTLWAWVVVNVPVMIFAFDGWKKFYVFSQERVVDWGSIFYWGRGERGWSWVDHVSTLNRAAEVCFAVCCVGIGFLAVAAPRRPRLAQLLFLTLAAFLLTNKVWSPQYVLWLLPLAVLARPKLPGFIIWQIGELIYFWGIWWYLISVTIQQSNPPGAQVPAPAGIGGFISGLVHFSSPAGGIDMSAYSWALFARMLTVLLLMALIVVDILRPGSDLVRKDGADDPAGGVLDGAQDRWRLSVSGLRPTADPA